MKKKYVLFILIFTLCLHNTQQVFASRAAPVKIPPIIYKDLKIVTENYSPENMGIVQAFDIKTNKLIWSKKIYEVKIKPNVEADTQWVFIKDMKIDGDKLVLINERQKMFTLDPITGENLDKSKSVTIIYISLTILAIMLMIILIVKKKSKV